MAALDTPYSRYEQINNQAINGYEGRDDVLLFKSIEIFAKLFSLVQILSRFIIGVLYSVAHVTDHWEAISRGGKHRIESRKRLSNSQDINNLRIIIKHSEESLVNVSTSTSKTHDLWTFSP